MPLTFNPVPIGAPAIEELGRVVRDAQAGDPLAPVTVIVPTNTAGVTARRTLARAGGLAGVQFLTVHRLAEMLAGHRLVAQGRRPLTTPVLNAMIRATLGDSPGVFEPVSGHEATVEGLRASYRELRELPLGLVGLLGRSGSTMARDVVRVTGAVNDRVWQRWHDETDLLMAALDAVDEQALARFGTIVVFLPERLSQAATELIARCGAIGDVCIAPGIAGDDHADRQVRRMLASLAERSSIAVETIRLPDIDPLAAHIDVVSVSDADDEIRAAVRRIVRAANDGCSFERIAVLWTVEDPYARALTGALDAADIPWNGPTPSQLGERLAGRAIIGLLSLDQFGFRRRDLFAWLATTPVRDGQGRLVPVAAWERIAREAGVSGRGDWTARLERWAIERRQAAERARFSGDERRADRAERDADQAADLDRFVTWLTHELGLPTAERRWQQWASWGHRMLSRLIGGTTARSRLPAVEQQAVDLVEAAIDRLAGLDEVAKRVDRRGFAAALTAELETASARHGRIGDGVLVGPLSTAIGLTCDVTIVLGAVDGHLPSPPASDPLIGDHDRSLVPLLVTGDDLVAGQRRHFIAALRSAPDITLGVARGDLRRSAVRTPSRWLDELLPAGCRHDIHQQSFTHGLSALTFPATPTEHRVRSLIAHQRSGEPLDSHRLVASDPALLRPVALIRARQSTAFTTYDGNLGGVPMPDPFEGSSVLAPTQLEKWASCPYRYFVERVLGVGLVDDRDDDLRISPLARGSLIHTVFDRFLRRVLSGELTTPAPDEAWSAEHRRAAVGCLDEAMAEAEAAGLTGRALLWSFDRRRLRSELDRWLDRDDDERATRRTVPVASEQRFGFPDAELPDASIELPGGRIVRFRGSIDRVDRGDDGSWFVTDHKSGKGSQYAAVKATNPVDGGRRLQLAVYAAAIAGDAPVGVTSEYSFTARTSGSPRNGFTITTDIWEVVTTALATISEAITAGVFVQRPRPPSYRVPWIECPVCDPDGLGTADAYRIAAHKAGDPQLNALQILDRMGR